MRTLPFSRTASCFRGVWWKFSSHPGGAVRKRLAEEGISADTPSGWDGGAKSRISKLITVRQICVSPDASL